jgi:hypothetical protein
MKKFGMLLSIVVMLALVAPAAQAFTVTEEVQVTRGTVNINNNPAPSADLDKAVKALSKKTGRIEKSVKRQEKAIISVAESAGKIATASEKNADAIKKADGKLDNVANTQKGIAAAANRIYAVLVGAVIAGFILALVALVAILRSQGRIERKVEEVPDRTVETILDPWSFEIAGRTVTWNPADKAAPQEIHVPKGTAGDLASFVRHTETRPGVARRNFRKTLERYFRGDFNTPEYSLQSELIESLTASGEIEVG